MRRDITNRKKNKLKLKKLNNKALTLTLGLSFLLIILAIIFFFIIKGTIINSSFENYFSEISSDNSNTVFSLDKISVLTSATADSSIKNLSYWNLNISQYSDIGIYLNNPNNHTITKLYLDEIIFSSSELGTPILYKKEFENVGTCSYSEDKILKNLDILDIPSNSDSPICIGFYNKNIKTDYLVSGHDNSININGTILKETNIPKSSIDTNINFNLHIITDLNEHYVCNINLSIPFEDNDGNDVYNTGHIVKTFKNLNNYKFLKIN